MATKFKTLAEKSCWFSAANIVFFRGRSNSTKCKSKGMADNATTVLVFVATITALVVGGSVSAVVTVTKGDSAVGMTVRLSTARRDFA